MRKNRNAVSLGDVLLSPTAYEIKPDAKTQSET